MPAARRCPEHRCLSPESAGGYARASRSAPTP
jgi:hypothetical protein